MRCGAGPQKLFALARVFGNIPDDLFSRDYEQMIFRTVARAGMGPKLLVRRWPSACRHLQMRCQHLQPSPQQHRHHPQRFMSGWCRKFFRSVTDSTINAR